MCRPGSDGTRAQCSHLRSLGLSGGIRRIAPGWWLMLASAHRVLARLRAVNSERRSTAAGGRGQRGKLAWVGVGGCQLQVLSVYCQPYNSSMHVRRLHPGRRQHSRHCIEAGIAAGPHR